MFLMVFSIVRMLHQDVFNKDIWYFVFGEFFVIGIEAFNSNNIIKYLIKKK